MNILAGVLVIILFALSIFWLGLRYEPKPLPRYAADSAPIETFPLPEGLPAPVARYYRAVYGEQIPQIISAVISGRARLRMNGLPLKGRFRFIHQAGKDYRHYIEVTFFGRPVLKVNEHYLDSKSRLELPFGVIENEPKVDQAANLGLWAESVWLPAIYLSDPRVCWAPVDDETAALSVPFGAQTQTIIVRFDPESGMIAALEAMRYKEAADSGKTLWLNQALAVRKLGGIPTLTVGAVTWMDEGRPWAIFTVEEIVFNSDVSDYVRAQGL